MLEKDKNCIKFSMHSMMLTHKPYQEGTEIDITGIIPGREILADDPFDIPCDVVMVPKKEFESLQTENEQLKKKLVWATEQLCCGRDLRHALQVDLEYYRALSSSQAKSIYGWKEATGCSTPEEAKELIDGKKSGGQVSVNGWEESAKFWKKRYDDIFKLVGFSSKEEVEDYLVNEAECDTLHEAILKLIKENKYACEEWCKANSSNNSWKAAAECNSPKELVEKRESLEKEIGVYSRALKEWKEGTGCPSPSAAKTLIESGASWHHAYSCVVDNLKGALRESNLAMQKELDQEIDNWQKATRCNSPEEAETTLRNLRSQIVEMKEFATNASNWIDRIVED